jgi:succinate dehydrogenase flavin-adding protein (antitoxin of CptAB toxin-antitoxin module)
MPATRGYGANKAWMGRASYLTGALDGVGVLAMDAQSLTQNSEERQALLREVKYRLSYRSTLELNLLCQRMMPRVEDMSEVELREVRDFLLNGENDLMAWLVDNHPAPENYQSIIKLFRAKQG